MAVARRSGSQQRSELSRELTEEEKATKGSIVFVLFLIFCSNEFPATLCLNQVRQIPKDFLPCNARLFLALSLL